MRCKKIQLKEIIEFLIHIMYCFSEEIYFIKKSQTEILELKTLINETKNTIERFNNKQTREKIF